MAGKYPLVSVITVTYGNHDVTSDFLNSVWKCGYQNLEVIVIDNSQEKSESQKILSYYPDTKLILSETNKGYAGGLNEGMKNASGDYFFLVNNDTEFTKNLIENLIGTFDEYDNVGIVSPKFHYFFHSNVIEYAGYERVHRLTGKNKMIGCGEKDVGQYDTPGQTNYTHGGGMMVSREVVNKVGPIPEDYFLYYEEFDWCERILNHGYKIYYQPKAKIYHKESMSTGKGSLLKTYYLTRNRILFMRRNVHLFYLIFFTIYIVLLVIPKNISLFLVKKELDHLKVYLQGILWHLNFFKSKKVF